VHLEEDAVIRERRRAVEEPRHVVRAGVSPVAKHRRRPGRPRGQTGAVRPVRADEPHSPRPGRLEPAERDQMPGVGIAYWGTLAGARQREDRRPRLSGLEGFENQLGEPVPNGKR